MRFPSLVVVAVGALLLACTSSDSTAPASVPAESQPDAGPPTPTPRFLEPITTDLGAVPTDGALSFEVPANALGFVLTVRSATGAALIEDLRDPSGKLVRKDQRVLPSDTVQLEPGTAMTAAAPAGGDAAEAGAIPEGTWTARVSGARGATATVAVQRTSDGRFHGGVLDLHVYVPEGVHVHTPGPLRQVSASSAAADDAIRGRVDGFFAQLATTYGIDRGAVTFEAVDASLAQLENADIGGKLTALCVGAQATTGTYYVLLSEHNPKLTPSGVTTVIPAAPPSARCNGSITLLAMLTEEEAARRKDIVATEANTLLHEFGHATGLFHTTETSGDEFDPLLDTPECKGATSDTASKCPDVANIMFPAQVDKPRTLASAMQKRIVQGSLSYRAYAAEQ